MFVEEFADILKNMGKIIYLWDVIFFSNLGDEKNTEQNQKRECYMAKVKLKVPEIGELSTTTDYLSIGTSCPEGLWSFPPSKAT